MFEMSRWTAVPSWDSLLKELGSNFLFVVLFPSDHFPSVNDIGDGGIRHFGNHCECVILFVLMNFYLLLRIEDANAMKGVEEIMRIHHHLQKDWQNYLSSQEILRTCTVRRNDCEPQHSHSFSLNRLDSWQKQGNRFDSSYDFRWWRRVCPNWNLKELQLQFERSTGKRTIRCYIKMASTYPPSQGTYPNPWFQNSSRQYFFYVRVQSHPNQKLFVPGGEFPVCQTVCKLHQHSTENGDVLWCSL